MTTQELAQRIKQKYPQYQDVDDATLAEKVIAKYPVYKDQIDDRSGLRKVGDFFTSSTQKFGDTIGTAIGSGDIEQQAQKQLATQDSVNQLSLQIAENERQGRDATKLKDQFERLTGTDYDEARTASAFKDGIQASDIFGESADKTGKQVVGEGLGTGLEVATFGTFGGASKVPTIVKPLTKSKNFVSGVKEGAKIGGGFGTAFGVSNALEEDKSLGEIAKEGAIGGATGAVGGAVLGGAVSGIGTGTSALLSRASKLLSKGKDKASQVARNKLLSVSRELVKMSPTVAKNEAKWNKNTPQFIIDEGVLSLIGSDGKKIDTKRAVEALKGKYSAEAEAFQNLITDSGEYVSLNSFRDDALNSISKDLKAKGSSYEDAIKQINKEIESYKNNYADRGIAQGDDLLIPINIMNDIKSGLWSKTSSFSATQADKLSSDINYQMGHAAKELIEEAITDTNVKDLSSRLGDFIQAIKVLETAEGKTVPGGFFGRQFTKLAGTIVGADRGIVGAILGNITGGSLADVISNPRIKTTLWLKVRNRLNKTAEGRSIVDEAAEILKKRGEERSARILLEKPKTIPLGSKIDDSRLFSQDEAQQLIDGLQKAEEMKLLQAPLGDATNPIITPGKVEPLKGKGVTPITNDLVKEAKKYKSADEFVASQPKMYHGTRENLTKFDNRGTYFTDDFFVADGFASGENIYEGYLNFKNPLVIDAKGKKWDNLKTKYGESTQEILSNVDSKKYDGVIFKNIRDNIFDTEGYGDPGNVFFAFNGSKSFKNESQLIDIWNKANLTK